MNDRDYVFSFLRGLIDNLPLMFVILVIMGLFGCLNGPLGGQ